MSTKIDLRGKDRVINLEVLTALGTYFVNLEFVGHEFGPDCDEVQVSVKKPLREPADTTPIEGPNRIVRGDNSVDHVFLKENSRMYSPSIWFEFHPIYDCKAVRAYDQPSNADYIPGSELEPGDDWIHPPKHEEHE